jgi:hypothetical protein
MSPTNRSTIGSGTSVPSASFMPRASVVEEERDVVVGVAPGGDDDVDLGHPVRHLPDAGDVAAEADHGGVDDGPDALLDGAAQLLDGVGDAVLLSPHSSGWLSCTSGVSTKTCSCR